MIKRKTCLCGNKFFPNTSANIYCPRCAGNQQKIKRLKNLIQLEKNEKRKRNRLHFKKIWEYVLKMV